MTTLRTGRNPNKRFGFTLIELILLTVIIATLVAISTPLFRKTFVSLQIKNASFNLAKLINFAQEKAVLESRSYKLVIDQDDSRYYFMKEDDGAVRKFVRLKDKIGRVFSLPKGIKLKSDKRQIIFYPDGHSEKATITLRDKHNKVKLVVKGRLGYVDVSFGK